MAACTILNGDLGLILFYLFVIIVEVWLYLLTFQPQVGTLPPGVVFYQGSH